MNKREKGLEKKDFSQKKMAYKSCDQGKGERPYL